MQEISYITERIELTLGENTTLQYLLSNVANMPYKEGKILLNNCLECLEVKIHRKCTTNCECNVQAMCVFFGEWKPSVGILKLLLFRLIKPIFDQEILIHIYHEEIASLTKLLAAYLNDIEILSSVRSK